MLLSHFCKKEENYELITGVVKTKHDHLRPRPLLGHLGGRSGEERSRERNSIWLGRDFREWCFDLERRVVRDWAAFSRSVREQMMILLVGELRARE